MASVTLKGVVKRFGRSEVVHGIDLHIDDREFVVLVGPSGCGKSTTLRMIAGLEGLSDGEVWIGERQVNDMAPKDRDAAMVFQNYALYPHMNVYDNMSFGLKLKKVPRTEIAERVHAAAGMLELTDLLKRKPNELSGGQRQRVAMGRAIVRNPSVFLFDEPLSNLDAKLRTQMRLEIKRLHRKVNTTIIYVTHDQVEAMTLADRIVVMRDGYIEQVGRPIEIFQHPVNTFVAGFIGSPPMNLVPARTVRTDEGWHVLVGETFRIPIPEKADAPLTHNREVVMGIRTEDLTPGSDNADSRHFWPMTGTVEVVEPLGSETNVHMDFAGIRMVARCEGRHPVAAGQSMTLHLGVDHLHLFDADSTLSIY